MLMFFIFQIGKFIYYTLQVATLITHVDCEEGTFGKTEDYGGNIQWNFQSENIVTITKKRY